MIRNCIIAALAVLALTAKVGAQEDNETIVIRGGHLFRSERGDRVPNSGIVARAGKFQEVGATLAGRDLSKARVIELADGDTILPGLFDLHAHFGMSLFGRGRIDETEHYPRIFLGNGVTAVFPAGEMQPDKMMALRQAIDSGRAIGPRIFNSGPYFGSARPRWNRNATADDIRREVDEWADKGARGFKAKGIRAAHLRALIDQAHRHGLTVTGHLGSGSRGSVNPRDAIAMGIDRIEHFMGGDAMPATRSAYASLVDIKPDTKEFRSIAERFIARGVYFDATLSAYGYFGRKEPEVFKQWIDEGAFFTPWYQEYLKKQPPRRVFEQFEKIYFVKRTLLLAFYKAGGGHLITLGTDHPSWGEFVSGCGVHRELHCMVLAGIPPAAALQIGTINGARALGVGDKLGSIEPGKFADLVVVRGNPLDDIRATRDTRHVMVRGRLHDPKALLESAKGKIGPANEGERTNWIGRRRR